LFVIEQLFAARGVAFLRQGVLAVRVEVGACASAEG
jgi:hypothetical protein